MFVWTSLLFPRQAFPYVWTEVFGHWRLYDEGQGSTFATDVTSSENVHHNCVAGDSHLAPLTASLALLKAQQGLRISRHRAESISKRQTLNVRAETESTKAPKTFPGPSLFTQTPSPQLDPNQS